MLCLACAMRAGRPLCRPCRSDLRSGPQFVLDGAVLVASAFHHHGSARRVVHRLKYDGLVQAGRLLAAAMVHRLPPSASVLVPVPRAVGRRIRHGVDPAVLLADAVSQMSGLPVLRCLRPPIWWPRHAAREPDRRASIPFRVIRRAPIGAVMIDDVITSGATLRAARHALGDLRFAVTATSPGLRSPAPLGAQEGGKSHD